ncbi:MEKHLA domain-containing protein [Methylocystis heyeri]|nr:MEKHLA domain-containing protein [Methylocystis heyeri]
MRARWIAHSRALLDSYRQLTGEELIARSADPQEEAERLFLAPMVVVSHGGESDPILNYGNRAALRLWEMEVENFIATPSRLTAEPEQREARARFLEEAERKGFVTGYEGIRISSAGRRFRISGATVWSVTTPDGEVIGQGATFSRWEDVASPA